jgi:hypothetical protein
MKLFDKYEFVLIQRLKGFVRLVKVATATSRLHLNKTIFHNTELQTSITSLKQS